MGLLENLRNAVFGRKQATDPGGIVHNDFVKSFAEKSAVAQALQKMGYSVTDPKRHQDVVDQHVRIARWLARERPDHPLVKHYKTAADTLNDPDVVKPKANPTQLGEFPEPERNTYYTVPNVGMAGKDLADAATPLVRFTHRIWSKLYRQPEFDTAQKFEHSKSEEPEVKPEPTPEVTPTIKPAEDTKPIPLVNYPGEIGRTGDRWKDIGALLDSGTSRVQIVRHLIDKYALSPRAAAATFTRFVKHGAKKLARNLKQKLLGSDVDPRIAGTRLAYHLHELMDHYKKSDPYLSELAKRALNNGAHRVIPWDRSNEPYPPSADPYADLGEYMKRKYTSLTGLASRSAWRNPDEPAVRLANVYNWHKIDKGLAAEQYMKTFLTKMANIKNRPLTNRELFLRAERTFDSNPSERERVLGAWKRKHAAGGDFSIDDLHNAIRRLADKEQERKELSDAPTRYYAPRDGEHHFRDAFRWAQENQHAKFSRIASVAHFLPGLQKEHQHVNLQDLHKTAGIGALADYLQENDDPREHLLRNNYEGNIFAGTARLANMVYTGLEPFHGAIRHHFGDSTNLFAVPTVNPRGKKAWSVFWEHPNGEKLARVPMTDEDFKSWIRTLPEENQADILKDANRDPRRLPHLRLKLDRKSDWISKKISIIMKDGIKGRKVSQKQAAAVAYHMWEKSHGRSE